MQLGCLLQYAWYVRSRSSNSYPFGDLLALARQSWLTAMAGGLEARGYQDYRRSDAAAIRLLRRGPMAVGQLGAALGVTRQAGRKVAEGLEQRGFAATERDPGDARQLNVSLTGAGRDYGDAVSAVIEELNREVARRVSPADLAAADGVLRAVMFDESTRGRAERIPRASG
jgi:DNA-binding MarR family transcriptional regulator